MPPPWSCCRTAWRPWRSAIWCRRATPPGSAIPDIFGVATFFIISGFIIYKTSRNSFGNLRGATQFILKRLIRIFPVYWIATVLFYVLSPHRAAFSPSDVVFSLLLIPHVVSATGDMHPLVGQGWTLQYEILFYALFAIGLFLNRSRGTVAIVLMLVALVGFGTTSCRRPTCRSR